MEILPNCYCNFNYLTERATAAFCHSTYWEAKAFTSLTAGKVPFFSMVNTFP